MTVSKNPRITINDVDVQQLFYDEQPVVTIQMIATVHHFSFLIVRDFYRRNREYFVEGEHLFRLSAAEAQSRGIRTSSNSSGVNVFTKKGYVLLMQNLYNEEDFRVQEQMLDEYFTSRKRVHIKDHRNNLHALIPVTPTNLANPS